jgi:DNA-binding CsgD family transcriptional regulator
MAKTLDKATLQRLYLKEKRATRDIAQITGWSPSGVRYRCIINGIKLRVNTWNRRVNLKKSDLVRLYVKEGKSSKEIAGILSCSSKIVTERCKEYGIPLRGQKIEGITKPLLHKLYIKEVKTTPEIAEKLKCSREVVRKKCIEFGIPLRNPGSKRKAINETTLRRLYVKEGKNLAEVARIVGCSYSVIQKRVVLLGLNKDKKRTSPDK